MVIKSFNEVLEHELSDLYYQIYFSKYLNDIPDTKLHITIDDFINNKLQLILYNKILGILNDDPKNPHYFFTTSGLSFIPFYDNSKVEILIKKTYNFVYLPDKPNHPPPVREKGIIKYIFKQLNNKMATLTEFFDNLEADYKAGKLILKYNTPYIAPAQQTNQQHKLKTNLSVKELAALFRLLDEIKPGIFDYKNKTEIYRFIASNFITRGKDDTDISEHSIKNHFNTIDKDASQIWESYLAKMIQEARDSRQK